MGTTGHRVMSFALSAVLIFTGIKYSELLVDLEDEKKTVKFYQIKSKKDEEEKSKKQKTIEDLEEQAKKKEEEIKELKKEQEKKDDKIYKLELEIKELRKKPKVAKGGDRVQKRTVPNHNSFKSYMDYRKITNKSSTQYKLQQQANTVKGFRMLSGRYLIALGSAFGNIGDYVTLEFDNGTSIPCIIGDMKANNHTDTRNMIHLSDGSIVEFIVDTDTLSSSIKSMGDCSYAEHINFEGKIRRILNERN